MIPKHLNIGANNEVIPYGRYLTTFDEMARQFVPQTNIQRRTIWEHFLTETQFVQAVYEEIAACWIGGSFITSKINPNDIDVVYLIKDDNYKKSLGTTYGQFASSILSRQNQNQERISPYVDAYIMTVPPTEYVNDGSPYIRNRGYWDQFWSKTRFPNGNDRWHYPSSGYLEVIVDDYK